MLRLPDYEEIRFRNPPLRRVVCQAKFPLVLSLSDGGQLLARFQESIRDRYPFLQQLQQISVTFAGPEVAPPKATSQAAWQFADAEKRWTITLAPDALTLETERYSSFDDLGDQMRLALDALVQHIRPGFATRLGLRYVNEIEVASAELTAWTGVLNEHWRSILDSGVVEGAITHWLQNLRLETGDGTLNVNVGLIPDERQPRVVIDLDYFDETQAVMDLETTMSRLGRWHEHIHSMFRWSISDEMLARLEAD
ncbi:MAG: TIGR04255 family protein [Dehalococcoidia bacterium]|nr:MAG: TIGR04255 family protein [Dehalococcoidia bacterium]